MNCKKIFLLICTIVALTTINIYAKPIQMDLFYQGTHHHYQAEEVKITIDGETLIPKDMPAVIIEDRVMLPMRQVAQELGCDVVWNEEMQEIYLTNPNDVIVFHVGRNTGYQNGKEFTMDVPAQIINNRTMLPVRALANALHKNITWDEPTRTVSIHTQDAPAENRQPTETKGITLQKMVLPNSQTAKQVFTIQADGAITNFQDVSVDGRKIVLRFSQAKNTIANIITQTNSNIVSAIYTTQQEKDGHSDTEMVLELKEKQPYIITKSADQTQCIISFDCDTVILKDISAVHKNDKDCITISATDALKANVYTLSQPNRIVVDIPNAKSELPPSMDTSALQYVLSYRNSMFTEDTFRLVLETDGLVQYQSKEEENRLVLEISSNNLRNVHFDEAHQAIYLAKNVVFEARDVVLEDHYLDGYFDIILPGNFENAYGNGQYEIGGDVLQRMEIFTAHGKTVLRMIQNRINAYEIADQGDQYEILIKNPKEVYDKVLLLDAGHGGKDPGTSGNGLVEKDMTLAIVQKVARNLQDSDIKVYLTRDRDVYPQNMVRAKTANQIADIMVSVHMNSGPTAASGTEVLYQVHANDNPMKLTSKKLAQTLQSHIIDATGNINRGIKLWEDVLILNATTVPTALIEVVFLTNSQDAGKIITEHYQQTVASAIAEGIKAAMNENTFR